jgi:cellulose synthase/poly-beta-1,6-N-acetylglucosamine synthase-like glycosyltransferase
LFTAFTFIAWFIVVIQLIYLGRFLYAFSPKPVKAAGSGIPVSIIVCAHDDAKNLKELVPLLLAQDYPEFEVIVVEDRCNDDTYDYLLAATKTNSRLKMVRVQHLPPNMNGKKYALTLGIKAASHAWVLLTDADCRPAGTQWIASMAAHFVEGKEIVIGYSPYVKSAGYLNLFIRFESLVTGIQFMGRAMLGRPYMGMGRNLAYRKSLFLEHKGFHKYMHVTGGDDDLFVNEHATRSNTAVCTGPDSVMVSIPKTTWKDFFYQKLRHLSVGKHYRFSDRTSLGLFSLTWILSWFFVLPAVILDPGQGSYLWAGFVLREMMLIGVVHRASRALRDPFEAWKTPLLDFNYAIYYLGTGLLALVSKRIRWRI